MKSAATRWIPATRLRPPRVDRAVARPRLTERLLAEIDQRALVVISAPAGSGKTTLVASALAGRRLAWLAITSGDEDPARFAGLLVAALAALDPALATGARQVLGQTADAGVGPLLDLMGAIIEDAANAEPFLLVLDDLHLVGAGAVCEALDYLLDYLPQSLRVIATCRFDPPLALARLRARGRLGELRSDDLRFDSTEAGALLRGVYEIDETHAADLVEGTNGWAAGLCLAGAALAASGDTMATVAALQLGRDHAFELFADEVFGVLPTELQEVLLGVCVLEEVSPAAGAAVSGRRDTAALLAEAHRRGLFLQRLEARGDHYRLHDLFRTFLLHHLRRSEPERLCALHRLAATAEPGRAVDHLLAAGDHEAAATMVDTLGMDMLGRWELDTLLGWIRCLSPEIRAHHPRLDLFEGRILWQRRAYTEARRLLGAARVRLEAEGDGAGRDATLVPLAATLTSIGELDAAEPLFEQALAADIPAEERVRALTARSCARLYRGQVESGSADAREAIDSARAAMSPRVVEEALVALGGDMYLLPGLSQPFRALLTDVAPLATSPVARAAAQLHLAWLEFLAGKVESSQEALAASLAHRARLELNLPFLVTMQDVLAGAHALLRGDLRFAGALWAARVERAVVDPTRQRTLQLVSWFFGRTSLLSGRTAEAAALLALVTPREDDVMETRTCRMLLEAGVAAAEERWGEAEDRLRRLVELQDSGPHLRLFGSARAHLARLLFDRRRRDEALEVLEAELLVDPSTPGRLLLGAPEILPVLELARSRGVCLELVSELLDALPSTGPVPMEVPDTGETLSPREVEVLHLVAEGCSNKDIAAELGITVRTVKAHMSKVLSKLAASSRSGAVARAREQRLI